MEERIVIDLEKTSESVANLINGARTTDGRVLQVYVTLLSDGSHFEVPKIGGEIKSGQIYCFNILVIDPPKTS